MRFTAELLLAALGTGDGDGDGDGDNDQHARAVAGAMAMADGLLELTRLRKMIAKSLSG